MAASDAIDAVRKLTASYEYCNWLGNPGRVGCGEKPNPFPLSFGPRCLIMPQIERQKLDLRQ